MLLNLLWKILNMADVRSQLFQKLERVLLCNTSFWWDKFFKLSLLNKSTPGHENIQDIILNRIKMFTVVKNFKEVVIFSYLPFRARRAAVLIRAVNKLF